MKCDRFVRVDSFITAAALCYGDVKRWRNAMSKLKKQAPPVEEIETPFGKLPAGAFLIEELSREHAFTLLRFFANMDDSEITNETRSRARKLLAKVEAKNAEVKHG